MECAYIGEDPNQIPSAGLCVSGAGWELPRSPHSARVLCSSAASGGGGGACAGGGPVSPHPPAWPPPLLGVVGTHASGPPLQPLVAPAPQEKRSPRAGLSPRARTRAQASESGEGAQPAGEERRREAGDGPAPVAVVGRLSVVRPCKGVLMYKSAVSAREGKAAALLCPLSLPIRNRAVEGLGLTPLSLVLSFTPRVLLCLGDDWFFGFARAEGFENRRMGE